MPKVSAIGHDLTYLVFNLIEHPIRGASRETFVLEDILRREVVANPHSGAHFWGTVGGAEVDQGAGTDPLASGVTRRGFVESTTWLLGGQ